MSEPRKHMRGAIPTPRHKLLSAVPFRRTVAGPLAFFIFPKLLSEWLNDTYGDCVTAEEAFNKGCNGIFIADSTVMAWASKNGVLDGADLLSVIQIMQSAGFAQDGNVYGDGSPLGVNYADQPTLNAAIYAAGQQGGCVKIGIAADQLSSQAGQSMGWTLASDRKDGNEDHCVGLCGYGTIGQFIAAVNAAYGLSLSVPTADDGGNPIDPTSVGVALYTWKTIGWVAFPALVNMCAEAWIRNPSSANTGGGKPTPDSVYIWQPGPTPPPVPPVPPGPTPSPPIGPMTANYAFSDGSGGVITYGPAARSAGRSGCCPYGPPTPEPIFPRWDVESGRWTHGGPAPVPAVPKWEQLLIDLLDALLAVLVQRAARR